ncbi:glycosyltransferase [Microbacterium limosum]|uniref:D-inositol 3-phosphate glycosyltransferase n=1 Tax=Microbacterium limosum TaxID=3079935 RepID=A0AAU0MFD6_9MICO|nr:glycosyltransferase [Microbacterium sp. Y20]WOQ69273.1 glycosyltransferase [Microbacterium sp. Y20]
MKIVHVTETLVGGVLAAVAALSAKQAALGHDVVVVYPRKPAVPPEAQLVERFPAEVTRIEVPYRGRIRAIDGLRRAAIVATRDGVDVVHLHSTFAGFAGRLSPAIRRQADVIAYSPHGWAFLRGDGPAFSNRAAAAVERALRSRCDGLILVSDSEARVTRERLGRSGGDVHVLQNGIPVAGLPRAAGSAGRPVVIASGRLMEQKAPDRFAEIARSLGGQAEFVWIGDGTPEERRRWIGDAPVTVTGWLAHTDVVARLAASDVFLFPSRWEGMPISLMEAQVMGLPAVATDIVGNRDVVIPGETGLLCDDTAALTAAVARLVSDRAERDRMAERAIEVQRERLSDARLGETSIALYEAMAGRRSDALVS